MIDITRPGDHLRGMDFPAHNAEMSEPSRAFNAGNACRVPIFLGTNTRYFVFNRDANPSGITFQQYAENPDVMLETQLEFHRWRSCNLLQDAPLGAPGAWTVWPDFQDYHEAAWFGCPIDFGEPRRQLGGDVYIHGGPYVELLRRGTTEEARAETGRDPRSGAPCHNIQSLTPVQNVLAMHDELLRVSAGR